MNIKLQEITVREITENYEDKLWEGVTGYNGRLDIRPKYQREFVYGPDKRNAVIETIRKGFPLNIMYWVKNAENKFEVLDGQQRTISICQFVQGDFSVLIDGKTFFFKTLTDAEKNQILNYPLMIYFCEGSDKEKLDWFRIINIAGERLEEQELRNAIYTGEWLTGAKYHFSRINQGAHFLAKNYLAGDVIRQKYLETALDWIYRTQTDTEGKCLTKIEDYMAKHQHDQNANELWLYFKNVIDWVKATFTSYRPQMKGIEWGILYNEYGGKMFNTAELEKETVRLMIDDDVTKKSGIYPYLLSGDEKYLNIRSFTDSQKSAAYHKQNGICPLCNKHFEINEMEGDHITPWSEGGKTEPDNLQMLCKECNRRKGKK